MVLSCLLWLLVALSVARFSFVYRPGCVEYVPIDVYAADFAFADDFGAAADLPRRIIIIALLAAVAWPWRWPAWIVWAIGGAVVGLPYAIPTSDVPPWIEWPLLGYFLVWGMLGAVLLSRMSALAVVRWATFGALLVLVLEWCEAFVYFFVHGPWMPWQQYVAAHFGCDEGSMRSLSALTCVAILMVARTMHRKAESGRPEGVNADQTGPLPPPA